MPSGTVVSNNYVGLSASWYGGHLQRHGHSRQQTTTTGNTIGGSAAGAGNVISGNNGIGINITSGANGNTIQGNLSASTPAGNLDLGNTGDGINLNGVTGTTVGGATAGARNVISGNNNVGIRIQGAAATGNLVRGNYIGLNAAGAAAVANTNGGITIQSSATGNTIGGTRQPARATSFRATPASASPCRPPRTGTRSRGT